MKKSELKLQIKEHIISILKEASEDEVKNQKELNKELEITSKLTKDVKDSLSEKKEVKSMGDFNPSYGFGDVRHKKHIWDDGEKYTIISPSNYDEYISKEEAMNSELPIYKYKMVNETEDEEDDTWGNEEDMGDWEDKEPTKTVVDKDPVAKTALTLQTLINNMKALAKEYKASTDENRKKDIASKLKTMTKAKHEIEKLL